MRAHIFSVNVGSLVGCPKVDVYNANVYYVYNTIMVRVSLAVPSWMIRMSTIARIHRKLHFKDSSTIDIKEPRLDTRLILSYTIIIAKRVKSQRGAMFGPK